MNHSFQKEIFLIFNALMISINHPFWRLCYHSLLELYHLPFLELYHLPFLELYHLPFLELYHLPFLELYHLPFLELYHLPFLELYHLPFLELYHLPFLEDFLSVFKFLSILDFDLLLPLLVDFLGASDFVYNSLKSTNSIIAILALSPNLFPSLIILV